MLTQEITGYLGGHRIAILGFGMEGQSTYRFLRKIFPEKELALADRDAAKLQSFMAGSEDKHLTAFGGENYITEISGHGYTLFFKSPGIPLMELEPFIPRSRMESQAGLFLKLFRNRIIGITGTKGKSTTASLVYEAMKAQGYEAMLAGNIGRPVLDLVFDDKPNRWYVFEMSSHMLETTTESPRYAVILNIYEEHLDHYRSFSEYAEAKLNLFRYQTRNDVSICSPGVLEYSGALPGEAARLVFGETPDESYDGVFIESGRIVYRSSGKTTDICGSDMDRKLLGGHNLLNIMACFAVIKALGVNDLEPSVRAVSAFAGLEHRLEPVGEFSGIRFYNDSISTIPQAAICAVNAVDHVDTLIIGGLDRGVDYGELIDFISAGHVPHVICLPATGHKICDRVKELSPGPEPVMVRVNDMKEAVEEAFRLTRKGTACVLSPAAASYGFYRNFEERGRIFKDLVRNYARNHG